MILLLTACATVSTWAILLLFLPYLRKKILDIPNIRSSHIVPTPRGGGIVFVLATSSVSLFSLLTNYRLDPLDYSRCLVILLATPLSLVGFVDDNYNISALWRFAIQLLTAILILLTSPLLSGTFYFPPIYILLTISVTAVINFTNFMDGLDGLVASCMAVLISALVLKLSAPWPFWILVGGLFGFLLLNWSPAKVFMGDVGSTFLGAVFAGLVLQAHSWPDALSMILVATPLLGDAALCVLRRMLKGHQVFQAHRLHLFQRLHQAGWPHARVSSLYVAATAVLAFALLWGGFPWVITLVALELLLGFWLDQQVAVPFSVASRS